jgi:TolB-like protein
MGFDEVGTARSLREHRNVADALVAKHGGRIVKATGDGVLLEFPSVVDAVECAVAVQAVMDQRNEGIPQDRRMLFRIGINLGDILIEGDDILGDGVNVAARLEGIAQPGGICISSSAYDQVQGKVAMEFADMGEQRLKNIDRPVRVYAAKRIGHVGTVAPQTASLHSEVQKPLPLPDKPSIAVLPFQNMSGDPEQEYFADGMVEEITTALSRFNSLFVIARNSAFKYKGKAIDLKQVGRELGVRYLLEGSVRKAGGRVRITGQLIEATIGTHLWADKFEGSLDNIFELQDRVTSSVVGVIAPKIERAEIDRATRKPTENLEAYDWYLRGMAVWERWTPYASEYAIQLFKKALELDPDFIAAMVWIGSCHVLRAVQGWMVDRDREVAEAMQYVRLSQERARNDAHLLARNAITLGVFTSECSGRSGSWRNPASPTNGKSHFGIKPARDNIDHSDYSSCSKARRSRQNRRIPSPRGAARMTTRVPRLGALRGMALFGWPLFRVAARSRAHRHDCFDQRKIRVPCSRSGVGQLTVVRPQPTLVSHRCHWGRECQNLRISADASSQSSQQMSKATAASWALTRSAHSRASPNAARSSTGSLGTTGAV